MAKFKAIRLSEIRSGVVLGSPICDSQGNHLLEGGVEVTDAWLKRLNRRGVRAVVVNEADISLATGGATATDQRAASDAKSRSPAAAPASSAAAASLSRHELPPGEPFAQCITRPGAVPYEPRTVQRFANEFRANVQSMVPVLSSLAADRTADLSVVSEVTSGSLDLAIEDFDLFAGYSANLGTGDYPSRHSIHVAMLAMSMGINMQLDVAALEELAIGCLVHDIGMLRLSESTLEQRGELGLESDSALAKHPALTMTILLKQGAADFAKSSLMVAYQMHERCNGGGYPCGTCAAEIHFLAKIAAVADMFVELITPLPRRPALLPHRAVRKILDEVKRRALDADAVRALLDTLSVYPIGSFVELSDHRLAKVIRATKGEHVSPIVEIQDAAVPGGEPLVLDLAADDEFRVTKAVAQPESVTV
ncbi:MAG: HD domain-containing protein [Planctomycetota bacterium]|nr:MAG: HD domain-containing protein [Planctomycetota bacterium]